MQQTQQDNGSAVALAVRQFVRRPTERLGMTLEAQDTDSRREEEFFNVARALAHDALAYVALNCSEA